MCKISNGRFAMRGPENGIFLGFLSYFDVKHNSHLVIWFVTSS